ncbi:ensconsin isoform X2 [Periophthalmus magnuspinnatus]|uniref:ensconsin isoform X2 n=1 Tax=Periophthalmus magnuspinnatus TaxID=409849 RepID=UPI002436EA3D|nr:ensconsin isoform X2 [Periophthalmus magnuspinnatus]
MAVQKKQSVVPPSQGPLSTRTVQSQRRASPPQTAKENGVYVKSSPQKAPCPVYKSEHIPATSRTVTGQNGLNVDERLKAARERREEQQKIIASREKNRLEREQRAKQHYELQLQERKKRLLEQRHREESRRAAVEEKRKQRLQEEKERYESAVRKTLEKSQRAQQNSQNRGRKPTKSNVSYHSTTTTNTITTSTHHKPQPRPPASPRPKNLQMRSTTVPQVKAARVDSVNKKSRNHSFNAKFPGANPSPQTTTQKESRVATSSPERSPRKSIRRHSAPQPPELPPVPEEEVGAGLDAPCPGNKRPVRTIRAVRTSGEGRTVKICEDYIIEAPRSSLSAILETQETSRTDGDGSPSQVPPCPVRRLPEIEPKPSAGTSDPEEAARVLAEKRREARLQREQEQQEGLQREEEERRNREALERRKAEERAQQQAEVQRLIEEKRRREEEEQRRAEEERAQALREAQLLQKQREEEQARERVRAEQLKQEREQLAQKEEVERQARKKRLEEIMKRTRRTDSPDTKPVSVRISAQPKENTQPVSSSTIEEAVKVVTKPTSLGLHSDDEGVPVVAFKERRSLRTLTGLDEIQSQQRAEVI